jgi:hypothetical protein
MEKEMALIGEAQVVTLAGKKFPVASQNWLFLTLVEQQCTEED